MRLKQLEALMCAVVQSREARIPEPGRIIWEVFCKLNAARGSSGFGPLPITYADVESFMRLNRWPLLPHHVEIVLAMDRALLSTVRPGARPDARTPSAELTPAAFDAVF